MGILSSEKCKASHENFYGAIIPVKAIIGLPVRPFCDTSAKSKQEVA